MRQLDVDEFGNRLFLEDRRFTLRLKSGKPCHLGDKKGDVIFIQKRDEADQFHHWRQAHGVNKMLMDFGAREKLILDFNAFDGEHQPVHVKMPCVEVVKLPTFKYRNYEWQYQLKPNGANRHSGGGGGSSLERESHQETKKQTAAREKREREQKNPRLFDVDPEDDL